MELEQFKGQNLAELSMVEVAYAMLEKQGDVVNFTDLLIQIQEFLQLSESQLEDRMARFYTDLNIDGRFISLGENRWGLRAWYAIDAIDEEIISSIDDEDIPERRRRKKRKYNAFSQGDDMIDYNDDDPEDSDDYVEDEEIFDDAEDDEDDTPEVVVGLEVIPEVEDDEEDEELTAYASDLDEFDTEDIDLDEELEEELEEDDEFADEEEEEVLEDDYSDDEIDE
ncbi:DNA-directed RNA polymerase subunit delta [Vaginisenegalia massiliensis]|uniref:DNA-directed RNA polymerase subunit delta n=1 Tax=Vaginisenegalia massiliensis TaxID=2058294 RepID=UPI000F5384C2|nr:DNA-directed RNA polymerase subunit delta [Vaginisenegalia massiliensis]